jgi:predicted transposase/invertase (TIGR01784 family)
MLRFSKIVGNFISLHKNRAIKMSKYINPYTDFGFKKLFGEEANKDLLIDFLNQLLPDYHQIAKLSFRNNENLSEFAFERNAIFDIHCEAQNGERFIVEMQKAKINFFKDRSLFYTTFPIREQAKKGGQWDFRLTPIYMIAILDFLYDEEAEKQKFLRSVALRDQDGDLFYDKLHFKFIQMPLFNKTENELVTHFDKWIYFLKNLASSNSIPDILREPIFEKAFHEAEIAAMTSDEYDNYQKSLMKYIEIREVINTAVESAEKDGAKKIAREMKIDGVSPDKIMKYTGLSEKEISNL